MENWILMGDVVASSKVDQRLLQRNFAKLVTKVNTEFEGILHSPLTVTLGDEFQGVVDSVANSAEVIFALEEYRWEMELPILIRYSLTLGEIETDINPTVAYGMLGHGLTVAREALVEMKSEEDRLVLNGEFPRKRQMALAMNLLLELQEGWKWKDREIIKGYFHFGDYKRVAKAMDKDVSLIWRRFRSLEFSSYRKRKKLTRLIYGNRD